MRRYTQQHLQLRRILFGVLAALVPSLAGSFTACTAPVAFSRSAARPFSTSSSSSTTTRTTALLLAAEKQQRQPPPPPVSSSSSGAPPRTTRARDLVRFLVEEEKCYTTESGARAFGDACAPDAIYEDRYEPQPVIGRAAVTRHLLHRAAERSRSARGGDDAVGVRIDKISDGDRACGLAWTWTCGDREGLRGTTYVELNQDTGLIQYVAEIPEPLFKPGDATKELLKAVTKDAVPARPEPFTPQTPTAACEIAKYLYVDLQKADPVAGQAELMRFLDDAIVYRDFNYESVLRGPAEVRQFVQDFTFPGIEFRPLRFDDGVDSTCFTWEVVLDGAPDTVKGISFYELDPASRRITYVRDVPESAIKPPILGKLARQLRPGLGVFGGVPLGSRPGGM